MITRHACQYSFSAWFTYDRLFRHTMTAYFDILWPTIQPCLGLSQTTTCSIDIFRVLRSALCVIHVVVTVTCRLIAHSGLRHWLLLDSNKPISRIHPQYWLDNSRPFVPPRYVQLRHLSHVLPVDISTPVNAPPHIANFLTIVDHVMETTHKYIAHGETPTNSNFYSLPVHVVAPINVLVLCKYLTVHPDRNFVNFLLDGFTNGFSVGYQGPLTAGQCRNLLSARSNPAVSNSCHIKKIQRSHTAGPFDIMPFPLLHCSPLGAVPKKDGTYRIILDLSSPRGSAINEGISPETYSVCYSSFDDAVNMVLSVGAGGPCYMAKLDIQHAFRLCPVRLAVVRLPVVRQVFCRCSVIIRKPVLTFYFQPICRSAALDFNVYIWDSPYCALFRRFFYLFHHYVWVST